MISIAKYGKVLYIRVSITHGGLKYLLSAEYEMPLLERSTLAVMVLADIGRFVFSVFGRRLNVRIHRCVAETFIPNPIGYEIVNHIDGCKQHNWVDNLEWCTRQENYFHAVDLELIDYDVPAQLGYLSHLGAYTGSCNGMSKLTEDDVREIRMNYIPRGSGVRCNRKELANQYGVSANLISKIVSGQIWTHV